MNTPNFIFVKIEDPLSKEIFKKNIVVTVNFRPLRQKMVYQFESETQGSISKDILRINHSNYIKIIEEF